MANNRSDLKPWFREDIARVLMSIYFTSTTSQSQQSNNEEFRSGFASALSGVALMIGVNPESFLKQEDIKLLQQSSRSD